MNADFIVDLFSLEGNVSLVTGGTGGLGSAIAVALAEAGSVVFITSRSFETAVKRAAELSDRQRDIRPLEMDVTRAESIQAACMSLESSGIEHLDCLVHAAGGNSTQATVMPQGCLSDVSTEAFRATFELNCLSAFLVTQRFLPLLARSKAASIITIGSMAGGDRPLSRVGVYSLAKAGVRNFTRWLSLELAAKHGERIRVNGIDPGFFLTEQNWGLLVKESYGSPPPHTLTERGAQIVDHTPFHRFGTPRELQALCLMLTSSRASSFITGQLYAIDGGFSVLSI